MHTITSHLSHETIQAAIDEATNGNHVAHINIEIRGMDLRVLAIRPWDHTGGTADYTLTFDDEEIPVSAAHVLQAIESLLCADLVLDKADNYFDIMINQGVRECEIVRETPTRIRIAYEMPNAGLMHGWRRMRVLGSLRCIW